MLNEYIYNYQSTINSALFIVFKITLIIIIAFLILSLTLLAIGCLIKSQKIKSKFLIVVPGLIIILLLFLAIPIILVYFKNRI